MTAVDTPRRIPVRRSQTRRAAWWLIYSHLYMAAWFWGVILLLSLVTTFVFRGDGLGLRGDGTISSVVSMGVQAALWFSFAMAIALSLRQLSAHLAAGLTRRSFVRANFLVSVVMAAVYALVMAVLLVVESAVVSAVGWAPRAVDGVPFDGVADAPRAFLVYLLVFATAAVAGLVVGMAYHRLGGLWGTVMLLPAIPPLFVVMMLLVDRGSSSWLPSALDSDALRMLLTAAIAVVYAVVYQASMRRVTV